MVHANPNFFNEEHLALLQSIADQAGIAVYNARLYESLAAARQRYQELFEDSIDPIIVTSLDGVIQEVNRQAAALSRQPRESLPGKLIWALQSQTQESLQAQMPAIHSGETLRYEAQFFPLERSSRPVEFYVRKVSFGGEDLLQWIIRDISERKQLHSLRDDLSAMIYHDLRAPLANIVSSLDMLGTLHTNVDDESEIEQQVLSIAVRSTDRMQRLINSLLDINRLEAGQPIARRKAVHVVPLIEDAIDSIQPVTTMKRQKVEVELQEPLPDIWVDEDMVRRVLINLLENATKFTPSEGAITLQARAERHDQNEWVRFIVQDTGPGIPETAQEKIFDKFTRLDIEHFPKGLGLGLAFCRLAVQAHGGTIGAENRLTLGSQFYFTVPAAPTDAEAQTFENKS